MTADNRRPEHVPHEHLGQIRTGPDARWEDYTRGTEAEARRWQAEDPANRRVVHWIYKEHVIIPASEPDDAVLAEILRRVLVHAAEARTAHHHLTLDAVVMITDAEAAAMAPLLARRGR